VQHLKTKVENIKDFHLPVNLIRMEKINMQTLTNVHGKEFPHHIPGKLNSANCFDKFNIIPKTEIEYENEL
jgi:hypothetical protein